LTSMGCPVGPWIAEQVEATARGVDGIDEVETELTFSPPWTPDKMSEDAKFALGF
jgi:metal-sulfur cluster biosynthetic enzyme